LESAHGDASEMKYEGMSYWSTIEDVTRVQADAIKNMMDTPGFTSSSVI